MKVSRLLMIISSVLILGVFAYPLWNIRLEAPQYPIPLGMNIHVDKFEDERPHDIKNINLLNHYVGMQYIPEDMVEFKIFKPVIIFMAILGLLIAVIAKRPRWYLAWFILFVILGTAAMYDFYLWEYEFGHNLDPKAIMNFKNPDGSPMTFQPPIFGSKDILNFKAHSYPRNGAFLLVSGIGLSFITYLVGRFETRKQRTK